MNKNQFYTAIVASHVACVGIGAASAYLFAKKKFEQITEERVAAEVEATKKYFSVLMMEKEKPSLEEIVSDPDKDEEDDEDVAQEEELTEADKVVIAKGQRLLGEASSALTNYQGYGDKPPLEEVVQNNIFDTARKGKKLPPKDPATGRFLRKQEDRVNGEAAEQTDDPYIITHEDFLLNDTEYTQENLKYFVRDKTLLDPANEEVDVGVVGEVNLTLFPQVPKDEPAIICVRNDGLEMDYEILLTHDSLTEYMGFGESDEDLDVDEYAGQD